MRITLVGCGAISRNWLRALQDMPDVEIVALVDLKEERAVEMRDEFNLEALTGSDLDAVLAETKPDAVFNCTWPDAHEPVTLTAFAHDCHVLGEKPLACSLTSAKRMIAAAEESGKTLAVIQNRRFDSRLRALRDFLAADTIGQVTTINADFYIGAHFADFRNRMKHVLLLDMAIHTFDAARFLTGSDALSAYCHEWNPPGSWYRRDASAVALFEMAGDVVFSYRGSWCSEGLNTTWESDWCIVGTKGSVYWNGGDVFRAEVFIEQGEFMSRTKAVPVPVPEVNGPDGHAGVIRDFVEAIREGRRPETDCTDNVKSLAMVLAAVESAESGQKVAVTSSQ